MVKRNLRVAGVGLPIIIAVIAVLAVGGIITGQVISSNASQSVTQNNETELDMLGERAVESMDGASETMMADDPKLKDMDTADLAADGSSDEPVLTDNGLIIENNTEVDTAFLPEPQPGEYVSYSGDLSYAETGDVVLFFHADWCPSCRGLENDINKNLSAIPDGVSIQKVDYDSETTLKKKYGIVRQHTLVQVDANGNEIQTLTGLTNTLNQVVGQL